MHEKQTTCEVVKGSPKTSTPKSSCIEGDRYCMNPMVESGILSAALPNHSSGTAVTTPPKARSKAVGQSKSLRALLPCKKVTTR